MRRSVAALSAMLSCIPAIAAAEDECRGWNALASKDGWVGGKNPDENTKASGRSRDPAKIQYITVHQTGSGVVAMGFKQKRSIVDITREYYRTGFSGHYMIAYDGTIYQFVQDCRTAYHVGIESETFDRYTNGAAAAGCTDSKKNWRCLKSIKEYDSKMQPAYERWDRWWGAGKAPWMKSPNGVSIGIELLGYSTSPAPKAYTEQFGQVPLNGYSDDQYRALAALVKNLAEKYKVPLQRSRILTHEDLNPAGRVAPNGKFTYDPGPYFDMGRLLAAVAAEDDAVAAPAPPKASVTPAAAVKPTPVSDVRPGPRPTTTTAPGSRRVIGTGVVRSAVGLRIRTGPSRQARILTVVPKGAELPIYGKSGDWYDVDYRGRHGFSYAQGVQFTAVSAPRATAAPTAQPVLPKVKTYSSSRAAWVLEPEVLRRTPSRRGAFAGKAEPGPLQVKGETGQAVEGKIWYWVRLENGSTGWLPASSVEFSRLRYVWHRLAR